MWARDWAGSNTRAAELVLVAQATPRAPSPGRVRRGRRGSARDLRGRRRGAQGAPIWPVFVAGVAFLYLWWLGILVFDLAFMWHRYIRRSSRRREPVVLEEELDTPSSSKASANKKQEVKASQGERESDYGHGSHSIGARRDGCTGARLIMLSKTTTTRSRGLPRCTCFTKVLSPPRLPRYCGIVVDSMDGRLPKNPDSPGFSGKISRH